VTFFNYHAPHPADLLSVRPETVLTPREAFFAADETVALQVAEEVLELLRRHVGEFVGAVDAERAQPIAVQHR